MDGRAARLAALLAMILAGLAAWRGLGWVALALAADFVLRAWGRAALSPVAILAGGVRRGLRLAPSPVDAGPKRFAAAVGAAFSLGSGLAFLAGHRTVGAGLAAMLAVCAGLEGCFEFCVACRIHPWLKRVTPRAASRPVGLS